MRKSHATPKQPMVSLAEARSRRTPIDWKAEDIATPSFTGVRVLDNVSLAELRQYIDWSPFFHTWELKGIYPRIFETRSRARRRGRSLPRRKRCWIASSMRSCSPRAPSMESSRRTRWVTMSSSTPTSRERRQSQQFHFLRQQAIEKERTGPLARRTSWRRRETASRPHRRIRGDDRHRPERARRSFRAQHDDYNAIMAEALADRLAEAFAEYLHKRARDEWGFGARRISATIELIAREVSRHPPRAGYPACPEHTEKGTSGASSMSRRTPGCSSRNRSRCGQARA